MRRLTAAIANQCRWQRLAAKWLLVPSLRVGHQWLDSVARAGQPVLNVHLKTIKSLAAYLAAPQLESQGTSLASVHASTLLVDQAVSQVCAGHLKYLHNSQPRKNLSKTILGSIEAVRQAGLTTDQLLAHPRGTANKTTDLITIMRAYRMLLRRYKLLDYADLLQLATERLDTEQDYSANDTLLFIPEDLQRSRLEKDFLSCWPDARRFELAVDQPVDVASQAVPVETDLALLRWVTCPAGAPQPIGDGSVKLVRAVGERNEIRAVFRYCFERDIPWDEVELLHTDTDTYVPQIYETFSGLQQFSTKSIDGPPLTFAEGLPCSYARPGRALMAWWSWIQNDFSQAILLTMIRERLLALPEKSALSEDDSTFARLAQLLRTFSIGFGRQRYLKKIDQRIEAFRQTQHTPVTTGNVSQGKQPPEEGAKDLHCLRGLIADLLVGIPHSDSSPHDVLRAAKHFVAHRASGTTRLDQFARKKLVGDLTDITNVSSYNESPFAANVLDCLTTLPIESRVLGSGPRESCLHVDHVYRGGHSGRRHTFILGLDDRRFPGIDSQDPLLLDQERQDLSPDIPTATSRLEENIRQFARLLARLEGFLTLIYSCQSIENDHEMFPSPIFLSAYRLLHGKPEADLPDLSKKLSPPVSFAPSSPKRCLDMTEWWLWCLTKKSGTPQAERLVLEHFPYLNRGRLATAHRTNSQFTAYDGHVPDAAITLDPTGTSSPVMSAHSLQTVGRCPRAFFFSYGLGIALPADVVSESHQWLDAQARGSLLHELFEQFMRELIRENRPPKFAHDQPRLYRLLDEKLIEYRDRYPIPNESTYQRNRREIEKTANTFLREEEHYCAAHHHVPVYLEASLGMQAGLHGTPLDTLEPIPLTLPNGKTLWVRGRIDRVDRIGDPALHTYAVWDYKTGNTWGHATNDLMQGRTVQPLLYVTMVGHRLREAVSPEATVNYFGFFFPGIRAFGDRILWDPSEHFAGMQILEHLCETIRHGAFIATNDSNRDCTYCDYRTICGDVKTVSESTQKKLENPKNRCLDSFRKLRLE